MLVTIQTEIVILRLNYMYMVVENAMCGLETDSANSKQQRLPNDS